MRRDFSLPTTLSFLCRVFLSFFAPAPLEIYKRPAWNDAKTLSIAFFHGVNEAVRAQ